MELHELPVHTHSAHQTCLHLTLSPPVSYSSVSLPYSAVPTVVPPVVDPNAFCFAKFVVPLFVVPLEAVHGILEVSCHVVNSSSHLITCHFPSWTPISCGKFVFPSHYLPLPILDVPFPVAISLPATSHLGRPVSCGKFVFPSHYLPLPILDVPFPVVNSSSHLITCHFPSWTSRFLW